MHDHIEMQSCGESVLAMQSIINQIHWASDSELHTAKVTTDEDYDTWRNEDEAEWQSVVHPAGICVVDRMTKGLSTGILWMDD